MQQFSTFQTYYSKLVDCLPTKEFSHYLVSDGVITLTESEDITSTTTRHEAAKLLLSRVSVSLQEGNEVKFKKLLSVMRKHGNDAIASLSSEIQAHCTKTDGENINEFFFTITRVANACN